MDGGKGRSSAGARVAIIATTAVLFAGAKGLTGYIPSPWGVGQLFIASFVPIFMVSIAETFPVAIGAALGSFLGDMIFLLPAGTTNPALALATGVPANFFATVLFGYVVKKYRSWPSFITATVASLTLGNLMAAGLIATVGPRLFAPLSFLTSASGMALFTLGLTVFWDSTSIPAVLIIVPILLKSISPVVGRSSVISEYPTWSKSGSKQLAPLSLVYAVLFLILGIAFFLVPWGGSITDITPIKTTIFVVAASLAVIGPVVGRIGGTKKVDIVSAA